MSRASSSSAESKGASAAIAPPAAEGRFGPYGGRYVPETLVAALDQLAAEYRKACADDGFRAELDDLLHRYVGRPTPLTFAGRLSDQKSEVRSQKSGHHGDQHGSLTSDLRPLTSGLGPRIYLKREDLCHTGAHKINNTIGQALLAVRMGKQRVIAETGAGQHGVATATACAHFGLECEVYMGAEDVRRQSLNVFRMKLLGAKVNVVEAGSRTLKDATNEAMRDWMGSVEHTHYILGSVVGPHPFPLIVRDFQAVIGRECRQQCLDQLGRLPDLVVACVGGGSNAAGIFHPFINDASVKLLGVEAGGRSSAAGEHAAPLSLGSPGVLHGSYSYVLQDEFGQTANVHSCSAGLDYPGVGPEHSHWKDSGRVEYTTVTDAEALDAFSLLARLEGVIPALESAHAVAAAVRWHGSPSREHRSESGATNIVINLSGRGDKDVQEAMRLMDAARK